jgi:hypothetical protein
MTDKFNTIETQLVAWAQADTDIMAIAALVHEKLKEDPRKYGYNQTPAIAVHALGYESKWGIKDNRHFSEISVFIEVLAHGGDISTLDGQIKQLVSLLIDKLDAESPHRGGKGINNYFDDVYVDRADIEPFSMEKGWLVMGGINVIIEIAE